MTRKARRVKPKSVTNRATKTPKKPAIVSAVVTPIPDFSAQNNSEPNLDRMYRTAFKVCRQRGYNLSDPDFMSAVNTATLKAYNRLTVGEPVKCLPSTLAARYALKRCKRLKDKLDRYRNMLESDKHTSHARMVSAGYRYDPIPLDDFSVLEFVAKHGLQKSATMLGMNRETVRARIDEISLRVYFPEIEIGNMAKNASGKARDRVTRESERSQIKTPLEPTAAPSGVRLNRGAI